MQIDLNDTEYMIIRDWVFSNNQGIPNCLANNIVNLQNKFRESVMEKANGNGELIKKRV